MSSDSFEQIAPNLHDGKLWLRHEVNTEDTMMHLALKCGTTVGQLCRANRMHYQDIIQMRRYIWLPVASCQLERQERQESVQFPLAKRVPNRATLPPHFYRQSTPNVDEFAKECDPLLITTKCM